MVVGELVRDAECVRGDARVCKRLVVAAAEEGVGVRRVFVDFDSGGLARLFERGANVRVVEAGDGERADLRPLAVVRASDLFEVELRDRLRERHERVASVVARA